MPGSGRSGPNSRSSNQTQTLTGMLQEISKTDLSIVTVDKRTISVSLASATKFFGPSGSSAKATDLQPGDQVSIEATQDNNDYFHATRVTQTRKGTAEDRAAAMQPPDSSSSSDSAADDDRPRLHRAATAGDKPSAQVADADSSESSAAVREPVRQSTRQAADDAPQRPAAPDPDDPGPPQLKRGVPQRRTSPASSPGSSQPVVVSSSRPSLSAEEVNGVTKLPDAPVVSSSARGQSGPQNDSGTVTMPTSGDPIVDHAREEAFSFSETLPNYIVKQFTTRFQTETAKGRQTSWAALDNVTADVVYENGKESYKNVLVNGKAPKVAIEKTGSWSTGEFASTQQDVLSPATDADFHNKRSTTIVNRAAWHYDFSVEQPNSHWQIVAPGETYRPQYTGSIWIDKENSRVLRIEMSARNMPKAFPLDTVESAVDYDYVLIGSEKFLLPVHSEALSCERGTSICTRNVIDFRNYKKYGADTSITFGAEN